MGRDCELYSGTQSSKGRETPLPSGSRGDENGRDFGILGVFRN